VSLVASAVFRETVRDRVPLSIVAFALLLIAASILIGQLTAGQDLKIIKDLGLAAIRALGLIIAIFIGIGLVSKEVERRSIYSLLAKPITRGEFVAAKYLGLTATLAMNIAAMTLAFYALLFYMNLVASDGERASWAAPATDPRILIAILLTYGELAVVTAIAVFFSTFSSALLSALLTFAMWGAGHFAGDLRDLSSVLDAPIVEGVARVVSYLLPNLAAFDIRAEAVYGLPVSPSHIALTLAYGVLYSLVFVLLAVAVFRRRDFR